MAAESMVDPFDRIINCDALFHEEGAIMAKGCIAGPWGHLLDDIKLF